MLHILELIIHSMVHYVLGKDSAELIIVTIYNKSLNNEVFKAVVVPLDDQVLETAKVVAVGIREVAFGVEHIVVSVHRC